MIIMKGYCQQLLRLAVRLKIGKLFPKVKTLTYCINLRFEL